MPFILLCAEPSSGHTVARLCLHNIPVLDGREGGGGGGGGADSQTDGQTEAAAGRK